MEQEFSEQTEGNSVQDWYDALTAVIDQEGPEAASRLLDRLFHWAAEEGLKVPFHANTPI